MSLIPLIMRELRCESRRAITYWLRIAGAFWIVVFLVEAIASTRTKIDGHLYFDALSMLMLCAIWVIVPFLTADCLSSEKREGTLPLLFLTSLSPMEVAVAKGIAQAIRALTVVLAAIPMLMLPVFFGGVTWLDATKLLMLALASLMITLSVGLLASSLCRNAGSALIVTLILTILASLSYVNGLLAVRWAIWEQNPPPIISNGTIFSQRSVPFRHYRSIIFGAKRDTLFSVMSGRETYWRRYDWQGIVSRWTGLGTANKPQLTNQLAIPCTALGIGFISFLAVTFLTSRVIRRAWRETPLSATHEQVTRIFFAKRFLMNWFNKRRHKTVGRNPIEWLSRYSTRMRVLVHLLTFTVIAAEIWILGMGTSLDSDWMAWQALVWSAVVGCAAFITAHLIAHARTQGLFELLLASPVGARRVMTGFYVAPLQTLAIPIGLLITVTFRMESILHHGFAWFAMVMFCVLFSLPAITLPFAFIIRNPITAAALAFLTAALAPFLVVWFYSASEKTQYTADAWELSDAVLFIPMEGPMLLLALAIAIIVVSDFRARYLSAG